MRPQETTHNVGRIDLGALADALTSTVSVTPTQLCRHRDQDAGVCIANADSETLIVGTVDLVRPSLHVP